MAFRESWDVSTLIENLLRQIVFYLRRIDVFPRSESTFFCDDDEENKNENEMEFELDQFLLNKALIWLKGGRSAQFFTFVFHKLRGKHAKVITANTVRQYQL